jgi:hypothetical protein
LIPEVDSTTEIQNHKRNHPKRPYVKGVKTLKEPQFVQEMILQWKKPKNGETKLIDITDEFPYSDSEVTSGKKKRETCDIVLTSSDVEVMFGSWEWAIEIKYLSLVGNNGNNNDYVMQKAISPYLKDRSLLHDIEKLKKASFGKRKAVIFYGFDFDETSSDHAEMICEKIRKSIGKSTYFVENPTDIWFSKNAKTGEITNQFLEKDLNPTPKNLGRVIRSVDNYGQSYSLEPVTEIIDAFMRINRISSSAPVVSHFSGLERHPCGQFGRVVGWEIK